jgi:RNA polymerase sigma-70 factor, ECF subfamily
MLAAIPGLRAFAISLCGNADHADDLVQEALLRALANINSFEPGTNMKAWLVTILRNQFYSEYRKRRREVEDSTGSYAERVGTLPEQEGHAELAQFHAALAKLPTDQHEALILVGALGFSYEEVASICGCAIGTVKSRVFRARRYLAELLSIQGPDDFGPDRTMRAVLSMSDRMLGAQQHKRAE